MGIDIKIYQEDFMKRIVLVLIISMAVFTLAFAGGQSEPAGTGKLTVEMFDRGTDGGRTNAVNNAWTNWIKEKVKKDLDIDITFVPVGRWSENTDIVNLMASGSAPDLCYTYNSGMIGNFRDQGGIMDLAPYIDKYLPDLKKLLGPDPALTGKDFIRRQTETAKGMEGKIFSIPSARVALAQRNIFIRKDWLDKLGLKVPTNLAQFHEVLIAFRDKDPGNVGRNRVVPYGQNSDARWGLADLINNSIQRNLSDRDRWINDVHEYYLSRPGYKEGVRLMNTWYNEKLIYQDFPLMTTADDFYNQIKSGVVGAFSQNWDLPYRTDYKINEELAKNVPGASFIPIDIGLNNKSMMDKPGLLIFIPSYSKNQIDALRYLNWLAKYENFHFLQVGTEGINHDLVNGIPRIKAATGQWIQNSSQNIDITMPLNGVEMGSQEQNSRVLALGYGNVPVDTIVNAYNISVKNARAPVVRQVTTNVNQYAQTLKDKADALLAQAIRANPADFDRIYDAGYRDWLSSGAQEVINERTSLWPR
jgi:putative aldouronate transport system substrate-binding protein